MEGKPFFDLLPDMERKELETYYQAWISGKLPLESRGEHESFVYGKGNKKMHITVSAQKDPDTDNIIVKIHDISKLKKAEQDLQSRMKELACIYYTFRMTQSGATLPEMMRGIVMNLSPAMEHSLLASARILLEGEEYATPGFEETASLLSADIKTEYATFGKVQVCYSENKPFLPEERDLIEGVAESIGNYISRRKAEEKFKSFFDNIGMPVFTMNYDGDIQETNAYLDRTFSLPQFPLLKGVNVKQFLDKSERERIDMILKQIQTRNVFFPQTYEFIGGPVGKDNRYEITVNALPEDQLIVTVHNVTDREKLVQRLEGPK
jgi:PAS domain-containing protein